MSRPDQRPEAIHSERAPAPIGPYSQAVRTGDLLFTSGQVAIDPATGELVTGSVQDEARQVMKNLEAVLAAAGASFRDVAKTQIFLADMSDFAAVNEVYGAFVEAPYPARSTVQVARLPLDVRVEIEMIARLGSS